MNFTGETRDTAVSIRDKLDVFLRNKDTSNIRMGVFV